MQSTMEGNHNIATLALCNWIFHTWIHYFLLIISIFKTFCKTLQLYWSSFIQNICHTCVLKPSLFIIYTTLCCLIQIYLSQNKVIIFTLTVSDYNKGVHKKKMIFFSITLQNLFYGCPVTLFMTILSNNQTIKLTRFEVKNLTIVERIFCFLI